MSNKQASPEQNAFLRAVLDTDESIVLSAVPGSGKTTVLVEAAKRLVRQDRTIKIGYAAFNKSIVWSMAKRLPPSCQVATLNAIGHQLLVRNWPEATFSENRTATLLDAVVPGLAAQDRAGILKLIKALKSEGMHGTGQATYTQAANGPGILSRYSVTLQDLSRQEALETARMILMIGYSTHMDRFQYDFDDQCYLPVLSRTKGFENSFPRLILPEDQFDVLLVDEAQDLSQIKRAFVRCILKPVTGRLIAAGDPMQAIYGFMGSDSDSMGKLKSLMNAREMPLNTSFRCPRRVVEKAREINPMIRASLEAPDGQVSETHDLPEFTPGTLVLCRTNAPLIQLAWRLIQVGHPVEFVKAKSLFEKTATLVRRLHKKHRTLTELVGGLQAYRLREMSKLNKQNAPPEKGIELNDMCETILAMTASKAKTVEELLERLESLLTHGSGHHSPIKLSTIHSAKGLEAKRVVLYMRELIPLVSEPEWQLEQEYNLLYVAYTRAQKELVIFKSLSRSDREAING